MRYVSSAHRVSLSWLYDVVQNDGDVSTKQQCVGSFAKGFVYTEMRKALVSIIGVFDIGHHQFAKVGAHKSYCAMSNRDARSAMKLQQAADEGSGVQPHDMTQHDASVSVHRACPS